VVVQPAVLGMLMGMSFIIGNELVNVVFGVWMQDSFGLQIAALGAASLVIGLSELTGEGLAGLLADRLGKERTIGLSLLLNAGWAVTLPWLGPVCRSGSQGIAGRRSTSSAAQSRSLARCSS
jgi:predicted MFS family arabinose efflux permease